MHQNIPNDKKHSMQGSVSQNYDLGFCYFFMTSGIFLENDFKNQNDHNNKFGGAILAQ